MIINIVLLVLGVISLIYGMKNKLKLWMVIGAILICCGAVSAYVDYKTFGIDGGANPNSRLPFVMDHFMK